MSNAPTCPDCDKPLEFVRDATKEPWPEPGSNTLNVPFERGVWVYRCADHGEFVVELDSRVIGRVKEK